MNSYNKDDWREEEYMGMFSGVRKEQAVIVPWAPYGNIIPLECRICGAIWLTKNIKYKGATDIVYGDNYSACERCESMGHSLNVWVPNRIMYNRGFWG